MPKTPSEEPPVHKVCEDTGVVRENLEIQVSMESTVSQDHRGLPDSLR